ncbi:MAG TPA: DUF1279 domain-containing protein [Kofleriaceae bacterium]|jgi:hypothetical protein
MSEPIEAKPDVPAVEPAKKLPLKKRLKKLYEEYGWVALCTYLGFTAISIAVFAVIIGFGFDSTKTSSGIIGTLIAAWLAAKVTVPLRIIGTLALTPIIGRVIARRRKARGEDDDDDDDDDDAEEAL